MDYNCKSLLILENNPSDVLIENPKLNLYKHYIKMLLEKHINSLICISKTGFGKTFTTINILKKLNQQYIYKSGYITGLSFYQFLYENKDKLIILDDLTNDIFKDKKMIALLKAALYETDKKRILSYDTTSKSITVPNKFNFTGRIIILCNETYNKTEDENFKALISRSIFYRLDYSYAEILEICSKIITLNNLSRVQENIVYKIIKNQINEASEFNFRSLEKLISMVKYNPLKAEELFKHSFEQDDILVLVSQLSKLDIPVRNQAIMFREQTGFSTRKYYRLKQKLKLTNRQN